MEINKKLDLKDIISYTLIIIGGLLSYFFIDSVTSRNETLKTKQALIKELPDLYPNIKIHYTNELTPNSDSLRLKIYLKNEGIYPVLVNKPKLYLQSQSDTIESYTYLLNQGFSGTLSPNKEFKINYTIGNYHKDSIPDLVRVRLEIRLDDELKRAYSRLLSESISIIKQKSFNKLTCKKFKYDEKVYKHGDNKIWNDFFENPR